LLIVIVVYLVSNWSQHQSFGLAPFFSASILQIKYTFIFDLQKPFKAKSLLELDSKFCKFMPDVKMKTDISTILSFLKTPTPQAWIDVAIKNLPILLIDHAQCEKKAASTALMLIHRYPDKQDLLYKLSRLAREELRHFEQVLDIMQQRKVTFQALSAARYARALRDEVSSQEPQRLVDTLIIGAIIEARSCERFAALAPFLDDELAKYYQFLLKSESRHFTDYLDLAQNYSDTDIQPVVDKFLDLERDLIQSEDSDFRFHSGCPDLALQNSLTGSLTKAH